MACCAPAAAAGWGGVGWKAQRCGTSCWVQRSWWQGVSLFICLCMHPSEPVQAAEGECRACRRRAGGPTHWPSTCSSLCGPSSRMARPVPALSGCNACAPLDVVLAAVAAVAARRLRTTFSCVCPSNQLQAVRSAAMLKGELLSWCCEWPVPAVAAAAAAAEGASAGTLAFTETSAVAGMPCPDVAASPQQPGVGQAPPGSCSGTFACCSCQPVCTYPGM
jgi:hypothetical protein